MFVDSGSVDIICGKISVVRDNLSLVLRFLLAATREISLPPNNETKELALFLQNHIMLEKGSSFSLEPVLDLLEETLLIEKFHTSFDRYVADNTYIKQAITDLHSLSHPMLFRFITILFDAKLSIPAIVEIVLELDIVSLSLRHLADTIRLEGSLRDHDAATRFPDGGEILLYVLAFLKSVLSLVSVHVFHCMIDAISTCDSIISCSALKLRSECLVSVKLDRLILFLSAFCGQDENAISQYKWGAEIVVPVLHLVVIAAEVKQVELPEDVIDSNHIKYSLADSLRTSSHPYVISCCLNIIAQSPSRDTFVSVFSEINSKEPALKPGIMETLKTNGDVESMSESLAELDIDLPTPMEKLNQADKSLQLLGNFEKEVGEIVDRMQKEMKLKEAISEQKIAAHEAKAQLLKTELNQLKEILEEKIVTIRQLEVSQSEAFRKTSEFYTVVSSYNMEQKRLKEEADNEKTLYLQSKNKCDNFERDLKEKTQLLDERTKSLAAIRASYSELNEKFDDLEKVLDATSTDCEKKLNEMERKLLAKEELEAKVLVDIELTKTELARALEEKRKLSAEVEKYQDEETKHADLVQQLAQLANIATKRNG
ncbi:hypothetical protein HK100_000111 [Physocladia obscura]|uniref:Uncharacterized protein n=1 Tax=Physocladia obscura TaxID=109957 RepID=A0AAD5XFU4_9FUNG|nr:hypothetical protein HK100_000111 [Physocladia obscura]